jgi:hypothetical protein
MNEVNAGRRPEAMKRDLISKFMSATLLGALFGWYIHHDYVTWKLRGRDAFIAYQARRFDSSMAAPGPVLGIVIGMALFAIGSWVVYEVIALCLAAAVKGIVRDRSHSGDRATDVRKIVKSEINVKMLKQAVDSVLVHLIDDLNLETVAIDDGKDFYWDCPAPEIYNSSTKPGELDVGRLSDDVDFAKLIQRGQSGDASYNLIHLAPLLRYIGETVQK